MAGWMKQAQVNRRISLDAGEEIGIVCPGINRAVRCGEAEMN